MGADPGGVATWAVPWLTWLDARCSCEVARLRARYALTMDELRGLYTSDEQVDHLLHGPRAGGGDHAAELLDAAEETLPASRSAKICEHFALDPS